MQIYPSLYNRLKTQHEMLPEITRNISEYRMQLPPAPGKWPAQGHIAHMARYQGYFISRIDAILEQDTPEFERYNADNDPDFSAWLKKPVDDALLHEAYDLAKMAPTSANQQPMRVVEEKRMRQHRRLRASGRA